MTLEAENHSQRYQLPKCWMDGILGGDDETVYERVVQYLEIEREPTEAADPFKNQSFGLRNDQSNTQRLLTQDWTQEYTAPE